MTREAGTGVTSGDNATESTVLIAYDGSEQSKDAVRYAARLLSPHRVRIVTAWEPIHRQAARAAGVAGLTPSGPEFAEDSTATASDPAYIDATKINQEGVALAAELGFAAESRLAETSTTVWGAIVEAARELEADLIVAGTRALSGWRALLQTSVSENLLKHAGCPVLIVPPLDEPLP